MDAPSHIKQDILHPPEVLEHLLSQCPDWVLLSPSPVAQGWDNVTYRLTKGAALRLPRRVAALSALSAEIRWLPTLAPSLSMPIPQPLYAGRPTDAFPYPWAVVRWMEGAPWGALHPTPEQAREAARRLARLLGELHQLEVPQHAPHSELRGGLNALRARDLVVRAGLKTLRRRAPQLNHERLQRAWEDALRAPRAPRLTWCHGDLHPFNLIAHGGALSAVIDWGDLTAGDPAVDLYGLWMMFDAPARATFRGHANHVCDATWARGKGWALALSLVLHHVYRKQPEHAFWGMAQRSLRALASEPG